MGPFADNNFKCIFLKRELVYPKFLPSDPIDKNVSISSVNGLAANRWQAINWSNGDPLNLCTYVSPCPKELTGVQHVLHGYKSGLILGLRQANERRRYKVTPSLIDWA